MGYIKVLRELNSEIKMPTRLTIGDPHYFNDYKHLVYDKKFLGKYRWKGFISLKEEAHYSKEYDCTCNHVFYNIIFAKDKELLNMTKAGFKRVVANDNVTNINLESQEYIIETNNASETIKTEYDGYFGYVINSYYNEKLEVIVINMTVGETSFERTKEILEKVFNCTLKENKGVKLA